MKISAKTKTIFRLLHKYIGFIFSIFIFQLTLTGILLLYPDFFGLNNKFISNAFILKKYKMLSHQEVKKLGKDDNEILLLENSLYFNKNYVDSFQESVINAIYLKEKQNLVIFLKKKINFYVLESSDNMIDILDITETPLADNIVKIGSHKNKMIYVQTSKANYLLENKELIQESKNLEISWMETVKAKKDIADTYLEIHQGKGVPLHRIITELHNGKILGSFLSYILLLSSLSLLFLIFSSFLFGINIRKVNK